MATTSKKKPVKKAASQAAPKTYTVVRQGWEVADSWSGPEETVPTLHLSEADRARYVAGFYATHNNLPSAPEVYTRTSGSPTTVQVAAPIYKRLSAHAAKIRVQLAKKMPVAYPYQEYGMEAPGLTTHLA